MGGMRSIRTKGIVRADGYVAPFQGLIHLAVGDPGLQPVSFNGFGQGGLVAYGFSGLELR